MANNASWSSVYKRINKRRKEAGFTWNQLAKKAGIKVVDAPPKIDGRYTQNFAKSKEYYK